MYIHGMFRFYIPVKVQIYLYMVQTDYVQFCSQILSMSQWSGFQIDGCRGGSCRHASRAANVTVTRRAACQ